MLSGDGISLGFSDWLRKGGRMSLINLTYFGQPNVCPQIKTVKVNCVFMDRSVSKVSFVKRTVELNENILRAMGKP